MTSWLTRFALILVLALLGPMSLTGCGGGDGDGNTDGKADNGNADPTEQGQEGTNEPNEVDPLVTQFIEMNQQVKTILSKVKDPQTADMARRELVRLGQDMQAVYDLAMTQEAADRKAATRRHAAALKQSVQARLELELEMGREPDVVMILGPVLNQLPQWPED